MSTTTLPTVEPVVAPPPTATRWHRPLLGFAAVMVALAVVAAAGLVLDDRAVTGSPVWLKPFKFAVSFALYSATLAWLLGRSRRARRFGWWVGTAVVVVSTVELVAIVGQAVRGRASHFNLATPVDETVYNVMGAMAALIWIATFVLAVVVSLQRSAEPATMWAIRFGLAVSLAGMLIGVLMTMPSAAQQKALDSGTDLPVVGAHSVGVADGGPSMPVTGWATTGGDLRVGHFVGLHALQVLPLLALALAWLAGRFPASRFAAHAVRLRLVLVAAAGYAGMVGLLTWQALRGQPLLHPDLRTLGAAAALAAVVAVGAAGALRMRAGRPGIVQDGA